MNSAEVKVLQEHRFFFGLHATFNGLEIIELLKDDDISKTLALRAAFLDPGFKKLVWRIKETKILKLEMIRSCLSISIYDQTYYFRSFRKVSLIFGIFRFII